MTRSKTQVRQRVFALCIAFSLGLLTSCTNYEEEVPRLIQNLRSTEPRERSQAALKLSRIGAPHANPAVPALIPLLRDRNVGVQTSAALALRKIGTRKALQALERAKGR